MLSKACDDNGAILGRRKRRPDCAKAAIKGLMGSCPGIRRAGFHRAVDRLFEIDDYYWIARRFVPDAFAVHEDEMELDIIEVVDTHPISLYKGGNIGILADALVDEDWTVRVVVFDSAGRRISELNGICYHPAYQNEALSSRDATISAEAAYKLFREAPPRPPGVLTVDPNDRSWLTRWRSLGHDALFEKE